MAGIVFIDTRVADIERLIAGLAADVEVVLLDPSQDGITQIAAALAGITDLDSVHIVSHGSSGALYLGSTTLTEDGLDDYEDELVQIGAALSADGDVLLYGCNVASGTTGESFIASLAAYTGADIAASNDRTGSALFGGDWVLEQASGTIESESAITTNAQAGYAYALDTITGTAGNDTLLAGTLGDDLILGLGGDDTIFGDDGLDTLDGGPGNDSIDGFWQDDLIDGGDGNDTIVGGAGTDSIEGGAGNDTIDGGEGGDSAMYATAGSGVTVDVAIAGPQNTFGAGVDVLVSIQNLFGSPFGDKLVGDSSEGGPQEVQNWLVGNLGDDTLIGNGGFDVLYGDDQDEGGGADFLVGGAGNDVLVGYAGVDTLLGGAGNDLIDGFGGGLGGFNDSMVGGMGDDYFLTASLLDVVVEFNLTSGGDDTIASNISDTLPANVENIIYNGFVDGDVSGNDQENIVAGNGTNNVLEGLGDNDTLTGGAGNDTLDGGAGTDAMRGGSGDDRYFVDRATDQVVETSNVAALPAGEPAALEGIIDTVIAVVTYSLSSVAYVENITLAGTATGATGNELNNVITGNGRANVLSGLAGADTLNAGLGNDTLDGGPGNDRLAGSAGNDNYVVNGSGDVVTEASAAGTDLVRSSVSHTLRSNVENLTLTGTAGINGTGNTSANTLTGNNAANTLSGGGSSDTLRALGGNDVLLGSTGKDTLTGGTGADKFDFNAALNATTNVDRITDFNRVDDTIRLDNDVLTAFATANVALAAGAFYKGAGVTAAHDNTDRIIYNSTNGNLYYDANGTGGAAAVLFATLAGAPAITAADFFIVN